MNADNSEIRRLLKSYYEGSLSPEGMTELQQLLAETRPLTPELEIECRMLRAIDEVVPEPPADLRGRLEQYIDVASAAERRLRRPSILLRVGAISLAAAACLSGVIFLSDMSDDLSPSTDPVIIARADLSDTLGLTSPLVSDHVETGAPTVNKPVVEAMTELPAATAETKVKKPRKARKKRSGARIITDPDEALAYIEATFDKIADNVQAGDRMLEAALIESTYCSILQNL